MSSLCFEKRTSLGQSYRAHLVISKEFLRIEDFFIFMNLKISHWEKSVCENFVCIYMAKLLLVQKSLLRGFLKSYRKGMGLEWRILADQNLQEIKITCGRIMLLSNFSMNWWPLNSNRLLVREILSQVLLHIDAFVQKEWIIIVFCEIGYLGRNSNRLWI